MNTLQDILDECNRRESNNAWIKLKNKIIIESSKNTGIASHILKYYKLLANQLIIEKDAFDIDVSYSCENDGDSMIMSCNIICYGKWIKLHCGNVDRIFFFDENNEIISDDSIHKFISKANIMKHNYVVFDMVPRIFYKFQNMPSEAVIKYFENNDVSVLSFDKATPQIGFFDIPKIMDKSVILDESMIITLCSSLSLGVDASDKYYRNNYESLFQFMENKIIYVPKSVFDECSIKISRMGGPNEKQRFVDLHKRITVIDDYRREGFDNFKQHERLLLSLCEKYLSTLVTGNLKFAKRAHVVHPEFRIRIFQSAKLVEDKNGLY